MTLFGLHEFKVMSFGLKKASSTFQRFIHKVLRDLPFIFPYLDDILQAFADEKQHENHLNLVFERLHKYGLRTNISKSVFTVAKIEFLVYLITPECSSLLPEKVYAILNYKLPETILDEMYLA